MGHTRDPTNHEKPRWNRPFRKGYNIRRNVSLSKAELKLIEPFLARNQNNFSAAIREIIQLVHNPPSLGFMITKERLDSALTDLYINLTFGDSQPIDYERFKEDSIKRFRAQHNTATGGDAT